MRIISLLFFFIGLLESRAQTDKDIKAKDVPIEIRDQIIKSYPSVRRVRYFKEEINDTILYEAAFRYDESKYELIFLSNNQLGSIKKQIEFQHIPEPVQKAVINELKSRYSNFSILKVKEISNSLDLIYEIKTKLKTEKKSGFYEIFFNKNGQFILEQEEILRTIPGNTGF